MDIILPVAGLGSRLRPQTWTKPKPLVGLVGKPMLAHVLDRLLPLNPGKLVFITGFLGDQIEAWAKANYDRPLAFVDQPQMLGQTDAIVRAREIVSDDALILFPDMLFDADFGVIAGTSSDVIAFVKEVDDPSAFGVAVLDGERVVKLVEKPQDPVSRLALMGIYYVKDMGALYAAIDEQMARGIKLKNEYFLADAVQLMIDGGAMVTTSPVAVWEDCGSVENLLSTNRFLLDREPPPPTHRDGATIIAPSFVAESAVLERAVVGPHASIGANAVVRDAVVRDAILEDGATIEGAVVAHSIVGRKAAVRGRANVLNVGDTSTVEL